MKYKTHIVIYQQKLFAFSLVELMAVITDIGILVALALPRFRTFIARARQAEAANNLGVINTLQKSYNRHYEGLGNDGVWWNGGVIMGNGSTTNNCTDNHLKNKLGFRVEKCDSLRYDYSIASATAEAENSGSSRLIYPGCQGSIDKWEMCFTGSGCTNKVGAIYNTTDIVASCE